jgi:hypothetical protein
VPRDQDRSALGAADPLGGTEFPRTARFGTDYWLSRCVGFRVDWPAGGRGVVEEVRFAKRHDRPDVLVVRAGRLRPRRLLVPTEDVATLSPRERRIGLSADPVRVRAAP